MARNKDRKTAAAQGCGWLIPYCDMMTLLLTFFVLLISMASLTDEDKRLKALASVYGAFGIGYNGSWDEPTGANVLSSGIEEKAGEAGPFEDLDTFEVLKPLLYESRKHDLQLISNSFVQIFSIHAGLLFDRGEATLSPEGGTFLQTMVPLLERIDYPILIRGHTTIIRDEFEPSLEDVQQTLDPSWKLSLERTAAVYGFLLEEGLDPQRIRMEGNGRFMPRFTNKTSEGRARNRRVDFILDKRTSSWAHLAATRAAPRNESREIRYKDFIFDFSVNGTLSR